MFLQFAFIGLCLLQEPDSLTFGRYFQSRINREQLEKTPKWITTNEPKVSAGRAVAIANEFVGKMEAKEKDWKPSLYDREIHRVSLVPVDNDWWYWQIDYEWFPKGINFGGKPLNLKIIVLMDGSVIQPKEVKFVELPPGGSND